MENPDYFVYMFALKDCIRANPELNQTQRNYLKEVFDFWNVRFFIDEFHVEKNDFMEVVGIKSRQTISAIGKELEKKGLISYKAQANGNTKITFKMGEAYLKFIKNEKLRKEGPRLTQPTPPPKYTPLPKEPMPLPTVEEFYAFLEMQLPKLKRNPEDYRHSIIQRYRKYAESGWKDSKNNPIYDWKTYTANYMGTLEPFAENPELVSSYKLNLIPDDNN